MRRISGRSPTKKRKSAAKVIASQMSHEKIQNLKDIFSEIDTNQDPLFETKQKTRQFMVDQRICKSWDWTKKTHTKKRHVNVGNLEF